MSITAEVDQAIDTIVRNGEFPDRDLLREVLIDGARTKIYGPVFGAMLGKGAEYIEDGYIDPHAVAGGLLIASGLYAEANARYLQQEHTLDGDALAAHQKVVIDGTPPVLVDEKCAVSIENSIHQVSAASQRFNGDVHRRGYQGAAGACNYGLWDTAMTTAKELVSKLRRYSRGDAHPQERYEGMTHLDRMNETIAQTVEGAVRYASITGKRIRIIDMGSGTGATIGAIIHALKNSTIDTLPPIAITCFEQTPQFNKALVEFLDSDDGANLIGLEHVVAGPGETTLSHYGAITSVFGDGPARLMSMYTDDMGDDNEIVLYVSDFAHHRLAPDAKQGIAQFLSRFSQVITQKGDLKNNSSLVNRRFFNLGANGPLNTGNRTMEEIDIRAGFEVVDMTAEQPVAINSHLSQHIIPGALNPDNDFHYCVSYKGSSAHAALALVGPHKGFVPTAPVFSTRDINAHTTSR